MELAGKLDLAKENYEIAIEKGTASKDANLAIFKEHLDKVTKKIQETDS